MTEIISLTSIYKKRLKEINDIGIKNKNFKANSFDFTRTFSKITKDKKSFYNEIDGYNRLLEDKNFVSRLIKDLKSKVNGFKGNFRYLPEILDKFPENNKLRDVFISIQKNSGIKDSFIPVSKKETFEVVDDYLDGIEGEFILVLDMEMKFKDLSRLLNKYLVQCKEIVLRYKCWSENKENFNFVLAKSKNNPEKLHMSFIPINIYPNKKDNDLISTLLICSNFKSVSFVDSEFPKYLYPHIKNKKSNKTPLEKLKSSQWVNSDLMCFSIEPEKEDNLFKIPLTKLIRKVDFKSIITFYNLEKLSKEYLEIKKDINKRNEILNLESMQSLIKSLGMT